MIKIQNINFQNKTIENVEANGETITNIEMKLLKTKFSITIIKEGQIIKKEIKKKKNEEVIKELYIQDEDEKIEIQPEPIQEELIEPEPIQEEIIETPDTIEEVIIEPQPIQEEIIEPIEIQPEPIEIQPEIIETITLAQMKELLRKNIPKENTFSTYLRTIKDVYNHFKISNVKELLITKEQDIIEYIETQYDKNSTIKNKICSIYKAYDLLNIKSDLFKTTIQNYRAKLTIQIDEEKDSKKQTIDEGDKIIEDFNNNLNDLKETLLNNHTSQEPIKNWTQDTQLYALLKIYLTYGVLRPSEITDCKITDTDDNNEKINYINIKTKKIVINNHKNNKKGSKIIDITDKQLLKVLRLGLNNYLITDTDGNVYKSTSAFSKFFHTKFNYNPYDLRKAITSKCISEADIDKIKQLEHNQGHSLETILNHYNTYNKK